MLDELAMHLRNRASNCASASLAQNLSPSTIGTQFLHYLKITGATSAQAGSESLPLGAMVSICCALEANCEQSEASNWPSSSRCVVDNFEGKESNLDRPRDSSL